MSVVFDYLEVVTTGWKKVLHNQNKMFAYGSAEEFVLINGEHFPNKSKSPVKLGKMKACYENALLFAMNDRKKYTYVEGYALGAAIPVMHAWVVDDKGEVLDPTWKEGTDYYGVPFDWDYIDKALKGLRYYGFIDDWRRRWPLLRGAVKNFKSKRKW